MVVRTHASFARFAGERTPDLSSRASFGLAAAARTNRTDRVERFDTPFYPAGSGLVSRDPLVRRAAESRAALDELIAI